MTHREERDMRLKIVHKGQPYTVISSAKCISNGGTDLLIKNEKRIFIVSASEVKHEMPKMQ